MSGVYFIMFRDRDGTEQRVNEDHQFKRTADDAIFRIGEAQRQNGATHVHHSPGLSRASWPDGTYIEVWRNWGAPA